MMDLNHKDREKFRREHGGRFPVYAPSGYPYVYDAVNPYRESAPDQYVCGDCVTDKGMIARLVGQYDVPESGESFKCEACDRVHEVKKVQGQFYQEPA